MDPVPVKSRPVAPARWYACLVKRKKDPMKKPGTHFEQIPIEEVKKITDPDVPEKVNGGKGNVIVEPSSSKTEPYSMWWPGSFQTER